MSELPLQDVRVLDLSPFLPGPFATQMFADLGATVIKIEPPGGEPGRRLPGGLYETANRNKRSIDLDLKSDDGRRRCHMLAGGADVVVEGFRPGVADRLGVSYDELRALNPRLVYCSISGFGQSGPKRAAPGHDVTYLAASGALAVRGSWNDPHPRRPGVPLGDLGASSYAAVAILAALHQRRRTGRGCHLDVAIADAALALSSVRSGPRLDNDPAARLHLSPSNDLFDTKDGVLAVGAVEEHFWQRLRAILVQHEPALGAQRFDDPMDRHRHGDELSTLLRQVFGTRTAEEWLATLTAVDVPVEIVRPVGAAALNEQARARGLVQRLGDETHAVFPVLRDGTPLGRPATRAPGLGADAAAITAALDGGDDPWQRCCTAAAIDEQGGEKGG